MIEQYEKEMSQIHASPELRKGKGRKPVEVILDRKAEKQYLINVPFKMKSNYKNNILYLL